MALSLLFGTLKLQPRNGYTLFQQLHTSLRIPSFQREEPYTPPSCTLRPFLRIAFLPLQHTPPSPGTASLPARTVALILRGTLLLGPPGDTLPSELRKESGM